MLELTREKTNWMLLAAITWRGFVGTKKQTILAGVEELKRDIE